MGNEDIRFGRWCLRPRSRQLLDGEEAVSLGGRAFDLLTALVGRRDRVVPRAELVEQVWPERVVEENNLAVQVLALRRVFGDDAIATVPGRGYRFTLAVVGDGEQRAPAVPPAPPAVTGAPPPPLPALHGRDEDLRTLRLLMAQHRMVTLVGAGGIGKSTLAAVAASNGAVWVELSNISNEAMLPSLVAQALGLQAGRGGDALPALAAALRTRELLLVLDNAEHVVDAAARLAHRVLADAPRVRLLATSQVPLKVEGERVLRLGALAVPPDATAAADAIGFGAVSLFVDQLHAADPRFVFDERSAPAVIALCRRLDGHALAIKLAAARAPLLGLKALTAALTQSLRLLGAGQRHAPTRQQTLRATLDWSHALLSADEQTVFRRLGVFAGGFTLGLAQAVALDAAIDTWAVADHLASLVDRSLVGADTADPPRYHLLATAREYAQWQLAQAGESETLRLRHAQALTAWFEAADEALWTTADRDWLARHVPELDNLRAAIAWSVAHAPPLATALLGAAAPLFDALVLRHEFRQGCAALEEAADLQTVEAANARLWLMWASCLGATDHHRMQVCAQHAERIYRALGDRRGLYLALCTRAAGVVAGSAGEAAALVAQSQALEQPDWPPRVRAWGAHARTIAAMAADAHQVAHDAAAAGIRLAAAAGASQRVHQLRSWRVAACIALRQLDAAIEESTALVAELRRAPVLHPTWTLANHAHVLLQLKRAPQARPVLAELFDICRAADWDSFDYYGDIFVLMALREQRAEDALRLIGWATRVSAQIGTDWPGAVAFRARVVASLQAGRDADACAALLAEGREMDREAVCATALRGG